MEKNNIFFERLFNRDMASPDTKDFLSRLAEEHPYFSPAQFFLLKQCSRNTEGFSKQLSRTSALFNNNYWLNYLLISETEKEAGNEAEVLYAAPGPVMEQTIKTGNEVAPIEEIPLVNNEPASGQDETHITGEDVSQMETGKVPAAESTAMPLYDEASPLQKALKTATETKEDTLVFEPLHTTDYFASIGVKLGEESKPADKLGQQMKSFTDWLKTMKKVHSTPQLETSQEAEQKIQVLAEQSNINGDVVTESMADVLFQQGRIEKAVEMLEKLSLLNPAKSAYFAAKIKKIKEQ